jgi:UDP:flavonoid glycosyltransferase YjiC (YdhE family)
LAGAGPWQRDGAFDVLLMADMARDGDIGLRIAGEIRALAELGYRTGLIHLPQPGGGRIGPEIQRQVRAGLAMPVDPAEAGAARLLVVHSAWTVTELPRPLRELAAERIVLVLDQPAHFDLRTRERLFAPLSSSISWAPTNRWVRDSIRLRHPGLSLEPDDWLPVTFGGEIGPHAGVRQRPAIGRISTGASAQWPPSRSELEQSLPNDGTWEVRSIGAPPPELLPDQSLFPWTIFDAGALSPERFIRELGAFVYFPGNAVGELPEAAIATALAAGRPVLLPPRLRIRFGAGPVYCDPPDVADELRRLFADPTAQAALVDAGRRAAAAFALPVFAERIARLAGTPGEDAVPAVAPPPRTPRALFLTANGTGLGHVARLLAIARRAAGRFEPVFATMAHAAPFIEQFGFAAEYVPSAAYAGADQEAWDRWFRVELEEMIDAHGARLVVFDGNNPTAGIVAAVASRGDCRFAWVRRGMYGTAASPHIGNAAYFDLILEPGEIAGERDGGVTARRRDEAKLLDPIRILDEDEMLPAAEARAALGLSGERPAVLIQLGAGANRDILGLTDKLIGELNRHLSVDIVLAEWGNATTGLSLWPGVRTLSGFPVAQYFNAFALSIAAAGYNTYHEVIAAGLPTIFIPNTAPGMDDQAGRAQFAQEAGAAFELPEDRWFEVAALVEVLLNDRARDYVRDRCRLLARPNGAVAAADALAALLGQGAAA